MIQAGKLRHRVTIQKPKADKNSFGEDIVSYVDDSKAWAHVHGMKGQEYFNAQQMKGEVTHNVRMRYRTLADGTRIDPTCRLKYDDRILLIKAAVADEKKRQLDLMCVEVV